jgi:uncharacterized OsmC-like protein
MSRNGRSEDSAVPAEGPVKPPPAGFGITIDQVRDFEFRIRFDREGLADLMTDEPPPHGGGAAPNPSQLLAAAVGNCLAASLVFAARKARLGLNALHAEVNTAYTRNERGRLRIGRIDVRIDPEFAAGDEGRVQRVLDLFEDFCVVTQSVKHGVEIGVQVRR